jgi:phosphohistidine phosphatase
MRLYLIRHAEAVGRTGNMPDSARHLTAEGRRSFREIARRLGAEGTRFSRILTSPLVRAVQTAEILAGQTAFDGEVIPAPQLAPGFDVEGMHQILDAFPGDVAIALVGHEPDLGRVVSSLLSLPRTFAMPKGAVAALRVAEPGDAHRTALEWLLDGERRVTDPEALVRLER